MSNDIEIEELRRIVEEERAAKRERMLPFERASRKRAKEKRDADPELYAEYRKKTNEYRKKNNVSVLHIRRKRVRLAGRPKPETCEVCGRGGPIVFEHDHTTNKFRGWTCQRCNSALGMVEDSIVVLEKLIVYLKAHNHEQ